MATQIAGPTPSRSITLIDIVIGIELFLLIVIQSRTNTFFPVITTSFLNRLTFFISIAFLPLAIVRYPYAVAATVGLIGLIIGYQYWFASLWSTEFSGLLLGSYQPLLLAPMVALISARFPASRFVKIFFLAAIVHLILYLFLYLTLDVDMIRYQAMSGQEALRGAIRRTHEAAGTTMQYSEFKIGTSGSAMSFLVLYSIAHLYGLRGLWPRIGMVVLAVLSLYGMWVSDSRWNAASTLVALLALLIPVGSRVRAWLGFGIAASAILLWIAAATAPFNLFSLTSSDRSGNARALEFEAANPVLRQNLKLGIGLPNQDGDLDAVFSEAVYIADLGYYGDLLTTGLVGVALVLLAFWTIARFTGDLSATAPNERVARFLSAYLVYLAMVQIVTPQLTSGVGGVFLSLALGYLGRRGAIVPPLALSDGRQGVPADPAPRPLPPRRPLRRAGQVGDASPPTP